MLISKLREQELLTLSLEKEAECLFFEEFEPGFSYKNRSYEKIRSVIAKKFLFSVLLAVFHETLVPKQYKIRVFDAVKDLCKRSTAAGTPGSVLRSLYFR